MIRTRRQKYNAVKTVVEGVTFDSRHEARRWQQLRLLERAGEICDLQRQVKFDLSVNGYKVTSYRPDAVYVIARGLNRGEVIVEDAKSSPTRTRDYVIRKKLMRAIHQIVVQEV